MLQDHLTEAFKGMRGVSLSPNRNSSLGNEAPPPLTEVNDMLIVEPPCHPREPVKVPDDATERIHCLLCGAAFTA